LDYLLGPAADLDNVLPLIQPDAACRLSPEIFRERLANAEYRPEWTWTASSGGSDVLAVVVWWGSPRDSAPYALDAIYVHESVALADRAALAAALISAGQAQFGLTTPPGYHVFVPADWRTDASVTASLGWRREAVTRAGLTSLLERLRFEWRSPAGVRGRSDRLSFLAEPDDEVFVSLFARVLTGSLDASSTAAASVRGALVAAREDVAFYRDRMFGERAWWRLAVDAAGSVVGFGIPSRNPAFPVVGYLGVVPEHRGRGYADDILTEITRILADEAGAQVIRADTDLANTPMAAALDRVGYRNFSRRLVFSAPLPLTAGVSGRWWDTRWPDCQTAAMRGTPGR
jgi:RimJ/RimL family protein N-acetyltransferase